MKHNLYSIDYGTYYPITFREEIRFIWLQIPNGTAEVEKALSCAEIPSVILFNLFKAVISNRRVTHKPSKVVHVVFETRIIFIDNMLNICWYLFEAFQYISCVLSRFKRAKDFLNYSGCSIKVVNAFIMLHHPIIYETASQVRSMQATSSITTFPTFDPTFFSFSIRFHQKSLFYFDWIQLQWDSFFL